MERLALNLLLDRKTVVRVNMILILGYAVVSVAVEGPLMRVLLVPSAAIAIRTSFRFWVDRRFCFPEDGAREMAQAWTWLGCFLSVLAAVVVIVLTYLIGKVQPSVANVVSWGACLLAAYWSLFPFPLPENRDEVLAELGALEGRTKQSPDAR